MKFRAMLVMGACVLVAVALLASCNKAELAKLRTDINTVTNDKTACDMKLGDAEKTKAELQKQKVDLEGQVQALTAQVTTLKAELEKAASAAAPAPARKGEEKKDQKKGKK